MFIHFMLEEKKMNEILGHSIHLMTSLAGGRLLSLFEGSVPDNTLSTCVQALNGESFAEADIQKDQLNGGALDRIRMVTKSLRSFWSALQFDVQLPEENVLIEPWMTDVATLKFNPELRNF